MKPRRLRPRRGSPKVRPQVEVMLKLHAGAAAWLLGVSTRTLRESVDAPRGDDGLYDARALVDWWLKRKGAAAGDSTSKALERMRAARALAEERKNAVAEGRFAPIELLTSTARGIAETMRARFAALEKAHAGNGSAALLADFMAVLQDGEASAMERAEEIREGRLHA